jgi:geranylgeranyl pyrophosphate synthase
MLSGQAVGGDRESLKQLALVVELLHNATLVHDDILDKDRFRRNTLTVHTKWSVKDAILVGDALAALALNLAVDYNREVRQTLCETALLLCDGEYMDMDTTADISEKEYLEKIKKKSSSLFRAASRCGAIVGGGSDLEVRLLTEFGENFGIAYQIRDDLSDIEALKRSIPQDPTEFRTALPIVHLYQISSEIKRARILQDLESLSADKPHRRVVLDEILDDIEDSDTTSYCNRLANTYLDNSKRGLNQLRDSFFKTYLIQMADSLKACEE